MHICLCPWALGICKIIGIRTYFGSVTAESVRVFHHFAFCIKVSRLATFKKLHLRTAFFCRFTRRIFCEPRRILCKIWRFWVPKSHKVFMEPPYTIVTPESIRTHTHIYTHTHTDSIYILFCMHTTIGQWKVPLNDDEQPEFQNAVARAINALNQRQTNLKTMPQVCNICMCMQRRCKYVIYA